MEKSIVDNPIFGLCQRLSTYRLEKGRIYDPKGKRSRLFNMIGYKLPRTVFNKLKNLTSDQWKSMEDSWIALMMTVLINREFQPELVDQRLIASVRATKLWFICFVLRHLTLKFKGGVHLIGFDDRMTSVNGMLKGLATWMQWRAMDYPLNSLPKEFPALKGWDHSRHMPTLPWFSGHLSRFRLIIVSTTISDEEIVNLCQMRTFGRALPVPRGKVLKENLLDVSSILSTEKSIDPIVLQRFTEFSYYLGRKLGVEKLPRTTHISVSTTGTYTHSQSKGGKASRAREILDDFSKLSPQAVLAYDTYMSVPTAAGYQSIRTEARTALNATLMGYDCLYDILGLRIFSSEWIQMAGPFAFGELRKLNPKTGQYEPVPSTIPVRTQDGKLVQNYKFGLMEFAYQSLSERTSQKEFKRFFDSLELDFDISSIPPQVGLVLLNISLSRYWKHIISISRYRPDYWILHPRSGDRWIPLWIKPITDFSDLIPHIGIKPVVWLTTLAEPSNKTRSVSKCELEMNILQQAGRFMLEPILAKDPRARIGLVSTNKMWDLFKYLEKHKLLVGQGLIAQSSDFKSATDHMALSLIQAMWTGFLATVPTNHPIWKIIPFVWVRRHIECDEQILKEKKEFDSHCGSFQGEPVSFLTLTLYNLVVDEMTNYYSTLNVNLYSPVTVDLRVHTVTAITGDDVVSLRTEKAVRTFRRIVIDSGMVLSPGKDGDSKRLMIFCEDHVLINYEHLYMKFTYIDVIKCRLLTTMGRLHADHRVAILSKGRMLQNQLNYFDSDRLKRITTVVYNNILDRHYSGQISSLRLPIHLPPSCGGIGLPILWSDLPDWEVVYVKYVVWLTSQPRTVENLIAFLKMRDLNQRVKYGIKVGPVPHLFLKSLTDFVDAGVYSGLPDVLWKNRIYSEDYVRNLIEDITRDKVPVSPYTGKISYDALCNQAHIFGFVDMWSAFDLIERFLVFQQLLEEVQKPEVRTLNQWIRRSTRFWKKALKSADISSTDVSMIKNDQDLDWRCRTYMKGFVLRDGVFDLLGRSGPTLQFSITNRKPPPTPQKVARKVLIYTSDLAEMAGYAQPDQPTLI